MLYNYIAITIGPIYKTFSKARRVKEFWAVSYLFSQIMKELTKQIYLGKPEQSRSDIILPFIDNPNLFNQSKVGLFPDWIIYRTDNNEEDYNKLPDYIKTVKNSISDLLIVEGVISDTEIEKFLENYLKIYYFTEEIDSDENPILTLSPRLHEFELQNPLNDMDYTPIIYKIFNNLYKTRLYNEHFRTHSKDNTADNEKNSDERHLSMEEIATRDIIKIIGKTEYGKLLRETAFRKEDAEDRNLKSDVKDFFEELIKSVETWDKLNNNENSFKTYHKYVAIVKADGDKIGETLKSLNSGEEGEFSNNLLQWGKKSKEIIESFSALPIFIGGDDILFFAPVVNNNKNIIEVITEINNEFNKQFSKKVIKPSLSFGVSITFYKFPLFEAMENAEHLLKDAKDKGGNGICFQLLKHSGSAYNIYVSLDENDKLKNILNELMNYDEKSSVISSVAYHLRNNEKVFEVVGNKPERINQFFYNNIEGYKDSKYIQAAKKLTVESFEKKITTVLKDTYKETMNEIYDTLRFTKFLKGFDENDR